MKLFQLMLVSMSLSSCASYHPLALSQSRVEQRLRMPAEKALRIEAAKIHHPLLARVPLNLANAKVDVEDGQIAAAGSPLLELVAADDIEIKLGAEPEDVSRLQPGQKVIISLVNNPTAPGIEGKIRLVAQRINPTDRLVDVFVSVPSGSKLLLGSYVRGEIMVASREGLVVPRDAVLPEDGSYTVYVVRENHAEKRQIQVGLQSDSEVEVLSPGLREGDQVATVGNRELADGMSVKEQNIK